MWLLWLIKVMNFGFRLCCKIRNSEFDVKVMWCSSDPYVFLSVSDSSFLDGANLCHGNRCSFEEWMGSKWGIWSEPHGPEVFGPRFWILAWPLPSEWMSIWGWNISSPAVFFRIQRAGPRHCQNQRCSLDEADGENIRIVKSKNITLFDKPTNYLSINKQRRSSHLYALSDP